MSEGRRKKDRTARLLRLQIILWQNQGGIEIQEIAKKCSVSERTVYRDLETLESELDVPIWEKGTRRGVAEGYFLPPITFTRAEAMNIFMAARLMQNVIYLYNPTIVSTFMKLITIVRPPLRQQIQNTIEYLEKQPRDERKIRNFDKLTRAWLSQHRVRLRYQELSGEEPEEHLIDPYYIEPASWGRSTYVIGYCHLKKTIGTFKVDLIDGDVVIEPEIYKIPTGFDAMDYLGSAWGIYADEAVINVTLLFRQRASKAAKETIWHPSQKTEVRKDGSMVMKLRIRDTVDFRGWILGWGDAVEVLKPRSLRKQIVRINQSVLEIYARNR